MDPSDLAWRAFLRWLSLPIAAGVCIVAGLGAYALRPLPSRSNPLTRYRSPATAKPAGGPGGGRRFAKWLRNLWGSALPGVYVIRDRRSGEVLYVGQSERSVYERISRHLQAPAASSAHQQRSTYDRDNVEVAIELLPAAKVKGREADLVADLVPRDNAYLGAAEEEASDDAIPF